MFLEFLYWLMERAWLAKIIFVDAIPLRCKTNKYKRTPYPRIQYPRFQLSAAYRGSKKFGKLKKQTVYKLKNAPQTRNGRNMVKSNNPNAPST